MCLSTKMLPETLKGYVESLHTQGGWITLWKTFRVGHDNNLEPEFEKQDLYEGKNTAHGTIIGCRRYPAGFHCYASKEGADWDTGDRNDLTTVPVKVRKKWIVAAGRQWDYDVVVCKHIVI